MKVQSIMSKVMTIFIHQQMMLMSLSIHVKERGSLRVEEREEKEMSAHLATRVFIVSIARQHTEIRSTVDTPV